MAAYMRALKNRQLTRIYSVFKGKNAKTVSEEHILGSSNLHKCVICNCGVSTTNREARSILSVQSSNATSRRQWRKNYSAGSDPASIPKQHIQPQKLIEAELQSLHPSIREELSIASPDLREVSQYYFDGKGKSFRPMIVLLMARVCNLHKSLSERILESQRQIAMITEMIHTASLMHDDVIDAADTRRGKRSINDLFGQRKSILAGNFVLSISSQALARIGDPDVVIVMSDIIEDLVRGEFMQLGSKEDENERFAHYLRKTYKKTASLMAHSCEAVAILAGCNQEATQTAYEYGRNIGMAFQLVDDILDFVSSDDTMGKPTSADLKLGLATAPVLFAAEKYPELNEMIMRRFSRKGDVERAREAVANTDSIRQSQYLATQHSRQAVRQIQSLTDSPEREALIYLTQQVLSRNK